MIPTELLERLRTGDRPSLRSVDFEALLEAAKCYGYASKELQGFGGDALNVRERTIDSLDRDHPGWRGYPVPETEGKRHAH